MEPLDLLNQLVTRSRDAVGRRRTANAMAPVNAFGLFAPTCFVAAYLLRDDPLLRLVLALAGVAILAVVGGVAVYFAVRHPDRLQSEEHLIQVKQLDLIATKGGKIVVNPVDLAQVARPLAAATPPAVPEPPAKPSNREAK